MDDFDTECRRCQGRALTPTERAFHDGLRFVADRRSRGASDSEISAELIAAGWMIGNVQPLLSGGSAAPVAPTQRGTREAAPRVTDVDKAWVRAGTTVDVAGRRITGGMIYAGGGLQAIHGYGPEVALVDPGLPVSAQRAHYGEDIGYWPSYAGLDPPHRAVYLDWLAGDRAYPDIAMGYPFLYLYGLERRALADPHVSTVAAGERQALAQEVKRLLGIYGGSRSFQTYGTALLDMIQITAPPVDWAECSAPLSPDSLSGPHWLRYMLARQVAVGTPVPWDWCLAWWLASDDSRVRTPATRCPQEFQALFRARFTSLFGVGLAIKQSKTSLKIEYRPASASFGGTIRVALDSLPDVDRLRAPLHKIATLAEDCQIELEPYSRWLGRSAAGRGCLQSLAVLPPELVSSVSSAEIQLAKERLGRASAGRQFFAMPATELLHLTECRVPQTPSKRECTATAEILERLGYGMEPDVRFHGPKLTPDTTVVMYRLAADFPATPSSTYTATTSLMHLFLVVAMADGEVDEDERKQIETHVRGNASLTAAEITRLTAHSLWLMKARPGLSGLKKKAAGFTDSQRESVARFLVSVAAVDGCISPEEVSVLKVIYPMLGLAPDSANSHIHALAAPSTRDRFTLVVPADQSPREHAIPGPPGHVGDQQVGVVALNMEAVRAIMADTHQVAALLGDIFDEDDSAGAVAEEARASVAGLDGRLSNLVIRLQGLSELHREEFEAIAAELGLLPDGALDAINDAAYEVADEALVEGDELLEINASVLEEMLA